MWSDKKVSKRKKCQMSFSVFSVGQKLVSDKTQFTSKEFKNFCTSLSIDHIMTSVYRPRSNGQAERFRDTFKRALRKNQDMYTDERSIHKFLVVYRITPNLNTDSGLSPAELMLARKIQSVFDRLLPNQMKKIVKKLCDKILRTRRQSFLQKL